MEKKATLTDALLLAAKAHQGQSDKGGQPYILHPLRLMMQFRHENLQIIALLHDVVEDSEVTLADLEAIGFNEQIVQAVEALTKREGEDYPLFIKRVAKNALATKVKIADLQDNLDVSRLLELTEKDFSRLRKYIASLDFLSSL